MAEGYNLNKNPKRRLMPKSRGRWTDEIVLDVYEMARAGVGDQEIMKSLGANAITWANWKRKMPILTIALERGRKRLNGTDGINVLSDYVFDALPKRLKKVWNQIEEVELGKDSVERVRLLLDDYGTVARQHLFLFALTKYNFNPSKAMSRMGMSSDEVDLWARTDPKFAELCQEILKHKGNFFEDALISAVARGETAAIIFANKTFNRDRGYGEKIEVTGSINHNHLMVNLSELDLSVEVRKEILEAVRRKKEQDKVVDGRVQPRLEHTDNDDERITRYVRNQDEGGSGEEEE